MTLEQNWRKSGTEYKYICNDCKTVIMTTKDPCEFPDRLEGNNWDQHFCSPCKETRDKAYDDYVDPLRAYH